MTFPIHIRIYSLVDPRTGETRYIGRTNRKLIDRLRNHWATRERGSKERIAWFRSMEAAGARPVIFLLEEKMVENYDAMLACVMEKKWLHKFVREGADLINALAGYEKDLAIPATGEFEPEPAPTHCPHCKRPY